MEFGNINLHELVCQVTLEFHLCLFGKYHHHRVINKCFQKSPFMWTKSTGGHPHIEESPLFNLLITNCSIGGRLVILIWVFVARYQVLSVFGHWSAIW